MRKLFDPMSPKNREKVLSNYRNELVNDYTQTDVFGFLEYACDRFREELEHTMQSQVFLDSELDF